MTITRHEMEVLAVQRKIAEQLKRANDLKAVELKLKYGYDEKENK